MISETPESTGSCLTFRDYAFKSSLSKHDLLCSGDHNYVLEIILLLIKEGVPQMAYYPSDL